MHDYRRLRVWHIAHEFTLAIYTATKEFPLDERFGLTSQLRRAAASIQANIAEGCARGSRADSARMFQFAIGSAAEVGNHLQLSRDLGYLTADKHAKLDDTASHIRSMLSRLLFKLRSHVPHN